MRSIIYAIYFLIFLAYSATAHPVWLRTRRPHLRPRTMSVRQAANVTSGDAPSSPSGTPKFVIAHHMVGNTFPYTLKDWADDIALASANGIDAFALNVGSDPWQPDRVADAYTAAANAGSTFKIFMSFDMAVLPCASPADADTLLNYIRKYSSHPAQFKYPPGSSKSFASTFSGENCKFGHPTVAEGWKVQFKDPLGQDVTFVPSFFGDPSTFAASGFGDIMDGDFNWNSAWPFTLTTDSLTSLLQNVGSTIGSLISSAFGSPAKQVVQKLVSSFDFDTQHLNALKSLGNGKVYMAAASPWFYTHYSPQTYNKNFIYLSDQLYPSRWDTLIAQRDLVDLVEVITWNDYGESHYIGPIKGAQPNSQGWVDGMDHTAWLDLTKYYATAFKTGEYPPIMQDKVYAWARPHPKDANAPDSVGKPANFDLAQDAMFAVVFAKEPATVTLATTTDGSRAQAFAIPPGVWQLSIPISAGGVMRAWLSRNDAVVVSLAPDNFTFQGSPQVYNYNAFVAMASAAA